MTSVPSDRRADYLVRAMQMADRYPWVQGATVFNLDYAAAGRPPGSEQFWFSLLEPSRAPRPAYTAIQQARSNGQLP